MSMGGRVFASAGVRMSTHISTCETCAKYARDMRETCSEMQARYVRECVGHARDIRETCARCGRVIGEMREMRKMYVRDAARYKRDMGGI